jgi:hypothetical protein
MDVLKALGQLLLFVIGIGLAALLILAAFFYFR